MTVVAFLLSLAGTSMVASLIPVTPVTEDAVHADFRIVPSMGDSLGA